MSVIIALIIALSSAVAPAEVSESAAVTSSCGRHSSRTSPPKTIRVFRIHRRGSSIPARVETWRFDRYIGAVMASGAWPNRVRESAKVGAVMIRQWGWWMVIHHQRGYSFRGRCYDIRDGDQYLRPEVRPGSHIPVKTMRAVHATRHVSLHKNGKFLRLGWSGGGGSCHRGDGYHVGEDAVRSCAEHHGMGWRAILRLMLSPNLRIATG